MKKRLRAGGVASRPLRTVAVVSVALLFAFVSTVSASISLAERGPLGPATILAPRSSAVVVPLALRRFQSGGASVEDLADELRRVLISDPLDHKALLALALAADDDGDAALAFALARKALANNPRSRAIRSWLLERHLRAGDLQGALAQIDRLLLLYPQARPRLLAALAILAREPQALAGISAMLSTRPDWTPNFFEALANQQVDPDLMRAFLGPVAKAGNYERALYIKRLVDVGRNDEVRALRSALLPQTSGGQSHVFNGGFRQGSGPEPFAWRYIPTDHASTELIPGGGLRADYLASGPATIADQLLVLPAGRYVLQSVGRVLSESGTLKIWWRVRCSDGRLIAEHPVPVAGAPQPSRTVFDVTGGPCSTQILSLDGQPAGTVETVTAEVARIAVDEIG